MADDIASGDSYRGGRRLEAVARKENSPGAWLAFAELKASKGSYAPAAMGFLNAGIAGEAAGDPAAAAAYRKGLDVCVRGGLKEPALMITSRLAAMLERVPDLDGAAAAYEKLGAFCGKAGAYFLAADAFEHAAEMLKAAGKDISAYRKPAGLWLLNAAYWAKNNNAGDEAWSRRRAELYLESIKK